MSDRSIGVAELIHDIAEGVPRNLVAIWQDRDGNWNRGWWFDGEVQAAELMGQLELAKLRIYDDSGPWQGDEF